jgi:dienelactone hydrolase
LAGTKPIAYLDLFQQGLQDKESVAKALIPVERSKSAILLLSGKEDQLWPSAFMADKVMERLTKHKHPYPYQHLCYEGAGHGILGAYLPMRPTVTMDRFALGGNVQANARALEDSRPKVLRFLRENLGPP